MTEAARYERIATNVRTAHDRARRLFLRRLAEDQARIAREAREQADDVQGMVREGGPRVVDALRARLMEAEREQARNILDTIERAPTPVLERMAALRTSIGTAIPDHPTPLSPSLERARVAARARTATAFEPAARFRARVGPARELVIAQVRTGLEQGASVRQIALSIRAEGSPPPQIPAYVRSVVDALAREGGIRPGEFSELAGDVRTALRRMGSATEAQSWRTLRPAVERLARAVESGNVARIEDHVRAFVETRMRFEAARIARTEASRAATRAQVESAQTTIGVTCLEWRLSNEHPVEDICDVYANADLYGFGPGRYPLDRPPELPAHPNCLCTLVPVIDAASIRRAILREPEPPPGRPRDESPEAWLLRQPAAKQALVVGSQASVRMRQGAQVFGSRGEVLPLGRIRVA